MITLKNITLRRGARALLDGASVTINPGEKVGLVGRNGAGKSSLFALLNGTLQEDSGEFYMPAQWRLAQVAQDMPEVEDSATDFVVAGDTRLAAALAEVAAAEALLHDNTAPNSADSDAQGERLSHAYMELSDAGAYDAPARAQALILGLGFKLSELEQPVNSFSGGWRMRLQLARALMCPSDLLLLDEPTNHLDLDALVWLEAWLQKYEGTMLVISHDREFLDAVTRTTVHIEGAQLKRYGGNYSRFEDMRAEQLEQQQSAFARQKDKIAHLQKFIDRFKAKASKAKQAQSRVKALERMEKIAPVLAEADFTFEFQEPANLPNPMLTLQDVSCGYYTPEPLVIVEHVKKSVLAGQRVGILGANGQGKSTLVKTLARSLPPIHGEVIEGKGLAIGYFAQQELDVLRPSDTPLEHMIQLVREVTQNGGLSGQATREQDLRSFLGSFNFTGDQVKQTVGSMSGGEKARLVLCMLVWQRPNLLLLDEPTNHLDLATREALSVALNEFEGTLMLVSHDRALLRAVCDEFWLVSRGGITPFDGDLDDYQRYLLDVAKQAREEQKQSQKQSQKQAQKQSAQPAPVQSEDKAKPQNSLKPSSKSNSYSNSKTQLSLSKTEERMAELELEKIRLENALAQASSSSSKPADAKQLRELSDMGEQLDRLNQELAMLEEDWLRLSAALET
ncbi:MAG: ATP-binding cassette domain-containing protein [Betaproteobacteria bacterium]|nr:ATP-binding cassette domain-containing protein [Betaproteobacteria bacterium]